jgi:hypothetical protein
MLSSEVWFMEDDLHRVDPPPFLIADLLPARSVNMFFGDSNLGKTFLALDMAASIASGHPWVGRETQQSDVLYIASEGDPGNLGLRTESWRSFYNHDFPLPILFYADIVNLVVDAGALLDEAIERGLTPRLVIIDTLGMALSDSENDNKVMNDLVKALRHQQVRVDKEGHEFEIAWLLVHHVGWDDKGRPRGGSSMPGGLDVVMGLKKSDKQPGVVKFFSYKAKNFGKFTPMFFEPVPHLDSLVYRYIPAAEARELLGEEAGGKMGTVRDAYAEWPWPANVTFSPAQALEAMDLDKKTYADTLNKFLLDEVRDKRLVHRGRGKYMREDT